MVQLACAIDPIARRLRATPATGSIAQKLKATVLDAARMARSMIRDNVAAATIREQLGHDSESPTGRHESMHGRDNDRADQRQRSVRQRTDTATTVGMGRTDDDADAMFDDDDDSHSSGAGDRSGNGHTSDPARPTQKNSGDRGQGLSSRTFGAERAASESSYVAAVQLLACTQPDEDAVLSVRVATACYWEGDETLPRAAVLRTARVLCSTCMMAATSTPAVKRLDGACDCPAADAVVALLKRVTLEAKTTRMDEYEMDEGQLRAALTGAQPARRGGARDAAAPSMQRPSDGDMTNMGPKDDRDVLGLASGFDRRDAVQVLSVLQQCCRAMLCADNLCFSDAALSDARSLLLHIWSDRTLAELPIVRLHLLHAAAALYRIHPDKMQSFMCDEVKLLKPPSWRGRSKD